MRNYQTYLSIIAVLSVAICVIPTESVPMAMNNDIEQAVGSSSMRNQAIHRTKNYRRLDSLLHSLSRQLHNEMRRANINIRKTQQQKINYKRNLKNLSRHITRVRKHLRIAQRHFNHYNRMRHLKYRELKKLYKSVKIQRRYMSLERHYVNRIQRESYKFKHYPHQYALIRKEVRELRRQLNIELNDLNIAYKKLIAKIRAQTSHSRAHRHLAHRRLRHHRNRYNRLMGRYRSLRRNYSRRLNYLHKRLSKNVHLKNQLRQELRLLDELRGVLKSYNPKDYSSLQGKYGKCKRDLHQLHRRFRAANCTA